jgi:bacteriocin biosynthesis cyclodehydratase domain-containing protein
VALTFAAHLEVRSVAGRGLVAVNESGCDVYSGLSYVHLERLVDGVRAEAEILEACDPPDREALASAITELRRGGVLIEVEAGGEIRVEAAWWSSQRVSATRAAQRIDASSVRVQALGNLDSAPMMEALADSGIHASDDGQLDLVLVDDYLHVGLFAVNAEALGTGRRWMLVQPDGAQMLAGPVFHPDAGPCWECLAQRLRLLRDVERHVRSLAGRESEAGHRPAPRSARRLGPALIATELTRWLAGTRPELNSMILSFDLLTWQAAQHHVIWRPQCPACGESDPPLEPRARPIEIRGTAPATVDALLRDAEPEMTFRRFEHHISPISGAVQTVRRLHGSDPLHVYAAGGPAARIHGPRAGWERFHRLQAGGKGTSDAAARASALCEALERFSGEFGGEEPRRRASYDELGTAAIHPNDYMRFSERQYEDRHRINENAASYRTWVPERFDPTLPIDWSPCWSLSQGRERLLPAGLLYYGADVAGATFCVAESNGNAAGNSVPEAILHGLLELIERDHIALWWFNRLTAPYVDLDAMSDPWLELLRENLARQGRELWALDLTADLGVPVAVALVSGSDNDRIGIGFGAHTDLHGAVVRAATEVVQLGLGAPSGGLGSGPDDLTLERYPFLRPSGALRTIVSAGPPRSSSVLEGIEFCRAGIEQQGIELVVLDQTRPDIGLPVVKVMAPGLRHFWTRFAPGRLYDVPVSLGRLDRPQAEEELTPRGPAS